MSPSSGNVGKWWVCGLLLLALMLNYMDRQTLSLTIVPISAELGLSNTQYGQLEKGFGSLGLFPNYYSLTQEISHRHQGKVTGALSCLTWVVTAEMQQLVGQYVDRTQSYAAGIFWVGLSPAVALLALCLLWDRGEALLANPNTET